MKLAIVLDGVLINTQLLTANTAVGVVFVGWPMGFG